EGYSAQLHALVYHGGAPLLPPEYLQDPQTFRAEGCRSSRLRFVARFLWLCLWWRPTVVFVDLLHLAAVPYLFRWLLPRGSALFRHGAEFEEPSSWLRRAAFRSATLRLSNSRFTARRLTTRFPAAAPELCQLGLDELALFLSAGPGVRTLPDAFGVPR